ERLARGTKYGLSPSSSWHLPRFDRVDGGGLRGRPLGGPYEFVTFDDYDYVRANPHVSAGLNWKGVAWAVTSFWAFNWHPLTWVSLQLDGQVYGLQPRGFHATN